MKPATECLIKLLSIVIMTLLMKYLAYPFVEEKETVYAIGMVLGFYIGMQIFGIIERIKKINEEKKR